MNRATWIPAALILLLGGVGPARAGLITNGNFENGNTGFTSQYTYNDPSTRLSSGYTVATDPSKVSVYSDWASFGDHTSGSGNMLIAANATTSNTYVWSETVAVQSNTQYTFSFWGATVNNDTPSSQYLPVMQATVNSQNVGNSLTLPKQAGQWTQYSGTWNSGTSTTATFSIYDLNTNAAYGDFALDDISLSPASATPEPASLTLLGLGGLGLAGYGWRRRKATAAA